MACQSRTGSAVRRSSTSRHTAPDCLRYVQVDGPLVLSLLREDGVHCAVAVVAEPNPASAALHESLGFQLIGVLREVGRKFDRWVDTRWYQLLLEP